MSQQRKENTKVFAVVPCIPKLTETITQVCAEVRESKQPGAIWTSLDQFSSVKLAFKAMQTKDDLVLIPVRGNTVKNVKGDAFPSYNEYWTWCDYDYEDPPAHNCEDFGCPTLSRPEYNTLKKEWRQEKETKSNWVIQANEESKDAYLLVFPAGYHYIKEWQRFLREGGQYARSFGRFELVISDRTNVDHYEFVVDYHLSCKKDKLRRLWIDAYFLPNVGLSKDFPQIAWELHKCLDLPSGLLSIIATYV